jgi:hypothetical protein
MYCQPGCALTGAQGVRRQSKAGKAAVSKVRDCSLHDEQEMLMDLLERQKIVWQPAAVPALLLPPSPVNRLPFHLLFPSRSSPKTDQANQAPCFNFGSQPAPRIISCILCFPYGNLIAPRGPRPPCDSL